MKKKIWLGLALALVIILGLLSRNVSGLPLWLGDSLWVVALYLALRFCWPRFSLKKIALVALALSFLDEFSQLFQ